eukprot:2581406-Pyramimonas_sp.AAC.1
MVGQPASYTELIRQDERDEELREVPNPPESTFVRPRSNASSRGRPKMPRSGAISTSRSNSNISMMETCWNWNFDCAPQAESRCPCKANKPEGACRHPVHDRTAAAKRQAEREAENRDIEMLASERQAIVAATNPSVDAKTVTAAVAAAR